MFARDLHGYDRNIATRTHLGPAFCSQGGIDGTFDSIDIQGVFRLHVFLDSDETYSRQNEQPLALS